MKTLKFKTNINCSSCVAKVSPFLNELSGVEWQVDTTDPDKVLTVKGENISSVEIQEKIKQVGFTSEIVNV
ncbi:hypothetical protein RCC89_15925 [Cytophagaceae bacterium ABcell3]|nr:hypothetical protein RCC89_15925 [Cytophagaceae bacterium ABcell3]